MSLLVLDPGVQCTVQAQLRRGYRHSGVPWSGPADPVSMALANRLVGGPPYAACLEIAYGPALFRADADLQIAVAGAASSVRVAGVECAQQATLSVREGDVIELGAAKAGARLYLAVSGQLTAEDFLASCSTYLPAGFGGHEGRALRKGDRLWIEDITAAPPASTPDALRLPPSASYALRVVKGPDFESGAETIASSAYRVSARLSRMGAEIEGAFPTLANSALRQSSAVFPGALQVTPQGQGFLLLPDCQTTGGYPHLLQVIRADRHLLGQIRPGDSLRFLFRTQTEAEDALRAKQSLLQAWMPDFRL